MSAISSFYQQKLYDTSFEKVNAFFSRFKNRNNIIYVIRKDFEFFEKDILSLENNKDFTIVFLDDKPDLSSVSKYDNVLFFSEIHRVNVIEDLNKAHNQEVVDIFRIIDMEIGLVEKKESQRLWNNIDKLVKSFDNDTISSIINANYKSYPRLLHSVLQHCQAFQNVNTVILYNSQNYYDTFGELFNTINDLIVLSDVEILHHEKVFYGLRYVRHFDFIKICIATTSSLLPKNTKLIMLKHSIVDDPNPFVNRPFIHIECGFKKPDFVLTSSKIFKNTIALGYPKLDRFIKSYESFKKETTDIMVATSSFSGVFEELSPVNKNEDFLATLVTNFPKNQIFFRPHPAIKDNVDIVNIVTSLLQYDNFNFDTNPSYIEKFSQVKVFISDSLGSSAYTYAFATLKPVIFYLPKNKQYLDYFGDSQYTKYRDVIGEVVTDIDSLIALTKQYLTNSEYYDKKRVQIKKLRESLVENIGESSTKISNFLNVYAAVFLNEDHHFKLLKFYKAFIQNEAKNRVKTFFEQCKGKKVAIYGAGEHFEKVFQRLYDFSQIDIVCFSDSNEKIVGNTINGIEIRSKNNLHDIDTILVSSYKYEKEITADLSKNYKRIGSFYTHHLLDFILLSNFDDEYFKPFSKIRTYLWLNIAKLELRLSTSHIDKFIKMELKNYDELFELCLNCISNQEQITFSHLEEEYYDENVFYPIPRKPL